MSQDVGPKRIFLVGPRGSGKTTVGLQLARKLQSAFWDTDMALEEHLNGTIADFVAREGWDAFREKEHEVLQELVDLGRDKACSVVSTGGGIILREDNRRLLRESGVTVYIRVPVNVLAARLAKSPNPSQRPSLTGKSVVDEVEDVLKARGPLYEESARHVVDGAVNPRKICAAILELVGCRDHASGA